MTKKASQDFVPTVRWANVSVIIKAAHLCGAGTKKAHSIEWAFRNTRPVPARDGGDTHMARIGERGKIVGVVNKEWPVARQE